ncbi:MAG TPA: hypothetical protein VHW24_13005 [Bryobacteraceae bacterium]|jgi:hypothetical protein|nr:hypothetical protein [Bryobacteraceae bacterium]
MKRSLYLVLLVFVCLLAIAPIHAQSDVRVTFHTSFPFKAGMAEMPAGSYSIMQEESGRMLLHPAAGGRGSVILLARFGGSGRPSGHASVTFVQRSGRYYLETVNLLDGGIVRLGGLPH